MASNFKLSLHRTRDSLHLKLYGDFDGTSAYELINTLHHYCNTSRQIFIDTEDLKTIHPFGRNVFQMKVGNLKRFIFIGKNKDRLYL